MANRGAEKRRRLFSLYSTNLSIYAPEADRLFACPICVRGFVEGQVVGGPDRTVDIAHVYPKASGGRHYTLECGECNGRLNERGDAELTKLHDLWDVMTPGAASKSIRGHITIDGRRMNIDVSGGAKGMHIHGDFRQNNPAVFRAAVDAIVSGRRFQFEVPGVHPGKINVGVLHSAHLLFFREFAYGYLFTPLGESVRQILASSRGIDDAPFISVAIPRDIGVDPGILYRTGVCSLQEGSRCLFAALPSADPNQLGDFVLLPGPRHEDQAHYHNGIAAKAGTWAQATYRTIGGGPPERLAAPEYADYLLQAWDGWTDFNVDKTMIMYAVYKECAGNFEVDVDVAPIGTRFGIRGDYLAECVESLCRGGFLLPGPSGGPPYTVRLTKQGARPIDDAARRGS